MKEEILKVQDREGIELNLYKWTPEVDIRAVVQLSHGMAECASRYRGFAEKLCNEGYAVYAHDHRGHGDTARFKEELGYIADKDGFNWMVEDMLEVNKYIKKECKDIPIVLFGHSMGSFLTQRYIQLYGKTVDAVILSGSNGPMGLELNLGMALSYSIIKSKGRRYKSSLINSMSFGGFNKKFEPAATPFAWLSRDERKVKEYIENEKCGFVCTASFYYDLFKGLKERQKKENLKGIPKDKSIFIISGSMDPVGNFSKGVTKLYDTYKEIGLKDVQMKLYEGARHEILNEINRNQVIDDIVNWIEKRVF